MCEIKTEDVYEDFTSNKEIFDFNIYSGKYYDDSKKLVTGKMKDETGGVANEEIWWISSWLSELIRETVTILITI